MARWTPREPRRADEALPDLHPSGGRAEVRGFREVLRVLGPIECSRVEAGGAQHGSIVSAYRNRHTYYNPPDAATRPRRDIDRRRI